MAAAVALMSQWTWQLAQQCFRVLRWTSAQLHVFLGFLKPDNATDADEERAELLAWVNQQLPGQRITNFGSDWADGQQLSALVRALAPRAVPSDQHSADQQPMLVVTAALRSAKLLLKVDPTLTVQDVVWAADERKLMGYLNQLRESATRLKKRYTLVKTPSFMAAADPEPHSDRGADPAGGGGECVASGTGLLRAERGRAAEFSVVFPRTSQPDLLLTLRSEEGDFFTQRVTERSPPRLAMADSLRAVSGTGLPRNIPVGYRVTGRAVTVTYRPPSEGRLEVCVIWRGHHVSGSPFPVLVEPGDPEEEDVLQGEVVEIVVSLPEEDVMTMPKKDVVTPLGATLRPLAMLRELSREDDRDGLPMDGTYRGVGDVRQEIEAHQDEGQQSSDPEDDREELFIGDDDVEETESSSSEDELDHDSEYGEEDVPLGTKVQPKRRTGVVCNPLSNDIDRAGQSQEELKYGIDASQDEESSEDAAQGRENDTEKVKFHELDRLAVPNQEVPFKAEWIPKTEEQDEHERTADFITGAPRQDWASEDEVGESEDQACDERVDTMLNNLPVNGEQTNPDKESDKQQIEATALLLEDVKEMTKAPEEGKDVMMTAWASEVEKQTNDGQEDVGDQDEEDNGKEVEVKMEYREAVKVMMGEAVNRVEANDQTDGNKCVFLVPELDGEASDPINKVHTKATAGSQDNIPYAHISQEHETQVECQIDSAGGEADLEPKENHNMVECEQNSISVKNTTARVSHTGDKGDKIGKYLSNASLSSTSVKPCANDDTTTAKQQSECHDPIQAAQETSRHKQTVDDEPDLLTPPHKSLAGHDIVVVSGPAAQSLSAVSLRALYGAENKPISPVDSQSLSAPISSLQAAEASATSVAGLLSPDLVSGVLTDFVDVGTAPSCDRNEYGDDTDVAASCGVGLGKGEDGGSESWLARINYHQDPTTRDYQQDPAGTDLYQDTTTADFHQDPAGTDPNQDPARIGHHQESTGTYSHQESAGTDPHQDPAGTDPDQDPAGTDPDQDPAGTDPDQDPAGTDPDQDPAGTDPDQDPAGTDPDQDPAGTDPDQDPAGTDPDQNPAGTDPDQDPAGTDPDQDSAGIDPHQGLVGIDPDQDPARTDPDQDPAGTDPDQDPARTDPHQDLAGTDPDQDPTGTDSHEGSIRSDTPQQPITHHLGSPKTRVEPSSQGQSVMGSIRCDCQEPKASLRLESDRDTCELCISTSDTSEVNPSKVQNNGTLLDSEKEVNINRKHSIGEQLVGDNNCHEEKCHSLIDVLQLQTGLTEQNGVAADASFHVSQCVEKLDQTVDDENHSSEDKSSMHVDPFEDTSDSDLLESSQDSMMAQDEKYSDSPGQIFMDSQHSAEASLSDSQLEAGPGYTVNGNEVHFERVSDDISSSGNGGDDHVPSSLAPHDKAQQHPARLSPIDSSGDERGSDSPPPRGPSPEGAGLGKHSDGGAAPSAPIGDLSLSISTPTWLSTRQRVLEAVTPADSGTRTRNQLPCDADMAIQSRPFPDDVISATDSHCPPEKSPSIGNGPETEEEGGGCDAQRASLTQQRTHSESSETERHLSSTTASLQSVNFPESGEVSQPGKNRTTTSSEPEVEESCRPPDLNQDNVSPKTVQNIQICFDNESSGDDAAAMDSSSDKDRLAVDELSAADSVTSFEDCQLLSDPPAFAGDELLTSATYPPLPVENQREGQNLTLTTASDTPKRKYSDLFSNFETPCEPRYRLHAEHDRSKVYLGLALTRARPAVVHIETPPCVLNEPPPCSAPAPAAVPVVRCDDRWDAEDGQAIGGGAVDGSVQPPPEARTVSPLPPPTPPPSPQPGESVTTPGETLTKTQNVSGLMTPAEALMTALSGERVIGERDASLERASGSLRSVSDELGDGGVAGEVAAADNKKREQGVSDDEVESSSSDSSETGDEMRSVLPGSKPPEKMQASEEIIEIHECAPRDSICCFGADGDLCDRSSTVAEPAPKLTPSATGMLEKLPRNRPAATDASLGKSSENDSQSQHLNNVDANVVVDTDVIATVTSEGVVVAKSLDSNGNAIYKMQDMKDEVNGKDSSVENDKEGQIFDKIIPENYEGDEAADIHALTASVKVLPESETGVIEKDDAGVIHESASSSDSSTSANTVRAVCGTPHPRTLSSCSQHSGADDTGAADSLPDDSVELHLPSAAFAAVTYRKAEPFSCYQHSGADGTDAVDSLPDDSVELHLSSASSAAATYKKATPFICSPSTADSDNPCSLSQVDTLDTPSTPDTYFSPDPSHIAETSHIDSATEDSSVTEELRVPCRGSPSSAAESEDHKKQRGSPDTEAGKGRKLVSKSTVYFAPGTPPPPQQDGDEPVLIHFISIDPNPIKPVKKVERDSHEPEVQKVAEDIDETNKATTRDGRETVDGSQREEEADESAQVEPVAVSAVGEVPEVRSSPQEPKVKSDRKEPASADAGKWLFPSPASLDGYVARIVRRHSTCEGDTTPPPPCGGRRLSPTNFCLEEAKKMLERGNRSKVKTQVRPWTEIGTEGRVVRLREMFEQFIQSEQRTGNRTAALQDSRGMAGLPGSEADQRPDPLPLTAGRRSHSTAALWRPVEIHSLEQQALENQTETSRPSPAQQEQARKTATDTATNSGADTTDSKKRTPRRRSGVAAAPSLPALSHRSLSPTINSSPSTTSTDANRAQFEAILRYFEGLRDGLILDGAPLPVRRQTPRHQAALSWLRRRLPAVGAPGSRFDLDHAGLRRSLIAMPPPLSTPTGDDSGDGLDEAESVVLAPAPAESPAPAPRVMPEYPYLSRRRSRPRLVARGLIPHQELVRRARDRVVVFGPGLFQGSVGADSTFQLYVPEPQCAPKRVSVRAASPTAGARCQLRYLGYMYHEVRYCVTEPGWYRVTVTLGAHAADVDVLVRVT